MRSSASSEGGRRRAHDEEVFWATVRSRWMTIVLFCWSDWRFSHSTIRKAVFMAIAHGRNSAGGVWSATSTVGRTCESDDGDTQPASEQHTSLLQFLGVGNRVFSTDFESLIAKQNQLATLRAQRDNFISTLQEISRELMQADELSVALTPQSIADADKRFLAEEQKLAGERDALLSNLRAAASTKSAPIPDAIEGLTQTLVKLQSEMEDNANTLKKARNRQAHLGNTQKSLAMRWSGLNDQSAQETSLLT